MNKIVLAVLGFCAILILSCSDTGESSSSEKSSSSAESSSSVEFSSSSGASSSSLVTYTLACAAVPSTGIEGIAIIPPLVTCNGMVVGIGLDWTGAPNWSNPAIGTYGGISVMASYGECYGKTASCNGTLTVEAAPLPDELTCTGMPATGVFGTTVTQPTVRCGLNTVTTGINWENAPAWANPAAGAYNVSATASCGRKLQTASCGTLTVVPTYTVTYNAGSGVTDVALPANQTKTYDIELTLSIAVPTRTGYAFAGWNTSANGTGMSYASGASYTDNASVTLYAQWAVNTYTVTYNAGTGVTGVALPTNQTKTYDVTLMLSSVVPTRTGYAFAGWNTSTDGTGTSYASGDRYTANAGTTLYAQWTVNTYTITYNANKGTDAPANQTKIHNVALTLSTDKPTTNGYAFVNWNTSSDGTGTSYASGASYTANADITLYAQWMPTYTIEYNANNGSDAPGNQTKIHNVALTLSNAVLTRTGYVFSNWNTSADGTGTSYAPGEICTRNSNVTLYAQWSRPVVFNCDESFETVKIGDQTWMAENLNCNVNGSKCYDNSEYYCDKYGRLYDWATAMALSSSCNSNTCASQVGTNHRGICPSGWHIPSDADWNILMKYVNPSCSGYNDCPSAGTKLKATSGWNWNDQKSGNGEDAFGFSALPGGNGSSGGSFSAVGSGGYWWSSTEYNAYSAYYRSMHNFNEDVGRDNYGRYYLLFSVRCLQD